MAREVVVDMLVAKGRTLLVHIFSGLVEEVLAAGRDLDIEPSKPPPEKPTEEWRKGVLAEEEARQDKCELLAEVVVRFFDAAKKNLQGTLDSAAAAKGVGEGGDEAHHIWLFLMGIRSALRKLSGPKDEGGGRNSGRARFSPDLRRALRGGAVRAVREDSGRQRRRRRVCRRTCLRLALN